MHAIFVPPKVWPLCMVDIFKVLTGTVHARYVTSSVFFHVG